MVLTRNRTWWAVLLLASALAALAAALPYSAPVFSYLFPALERPVYAQEPFVGLLLQHGALVAVSSVFAVVVGTAVGLGVMQPWGRPFKPLIDSVLAVSQAFPPVAVLALAVPVVGFGELPALLALALYGLLPVVQGAISGLQNVSPVQRQSALSLGLTRLQCLREIDIPLALPVWLAGVRTSVIINIGTATIASTVGAKTLGTPIIVGLSGFNTAYVLQGALLVALLAITVDMVFERLAQRVTFRY